MINLMILAEAAKEASAPSIWSAPLALGALLAGLAIALILSEKLLQNYGECKISINNGEKELVVEGGQTLLTVMQDAGYAVPAPCGGKGTCGCCKVTVTEGGGEALPTEVPYLSKTELKSNTRLACQVKIRSDMVVSSASKTYTIIEDKCIGCTACSRKCPVNAISGEKKKPHVIDQSLCTHCGFCYDTCKFGAILEE